MGQKVNPISFRLGNTLSWKSRWYADGAAYASTLLEDYRIRRALKDKLSGAGVVTIGIERSPSALTIILHVAKPGVVIGKGGSNLEEVKKVVERLVNVSKSKKDRVKIDLKVEEVQQPDLSAKLVAERITNQLQKRFPHRRAVSQALEKAMQAGAKGIKIELSGRIGGAEIGRREKYSEGSVPTQTLRAKIDYYQAPIPTRSGYVGLKVWIYTGDAVE
ncbi:MAG: 30S ribosomal protein S3 [Pseudomonadales bacterium]|nr:30S ribosomal protein S3 [Candidatus Woesebacteria bacterium]MCB9801711.1 30S ribosomal protein S3 [Pseudomonadales bacterium]